MRYLTATSKRQTASAASAAAHWSGVELQLGGATAIALAGRGGGSGDEDDSEQVPMQEMHVGFVIEYNDDGIREHARKANVCQY